MLHQSFSTGTPAIFSKQLAQLGFPFHIEQSVEGYEPIVSPWSQRADPSISPPPWTEPAGFARGKSTTSAYYTVCRPRNGCSILNSLENGMVLQCGPADRTSDGRFTRGVPMLRASRLEIVENCHKRSCQPCRKSGIFSSEVVNTLAALATPVYHPKGAALTVVNKTGKQAVVAILGPGDFSGNRPWQASPFAW